MRVLKPIVAEVSPNLYTAAQRANMTPAEQNQAYAVLMAQLTEARRRRKGRP